MKHSSLRNIDLTRCPAKWTIFFFAVKHFKSFKNTDVNGTWILFIVYTLPSMWNPLL